jgi:hypothetical protein
MTADFQPQPRATQNHGHDFFENWNSLLSQFRLSRIERLSTMRRQTRTPENEAGVTRDTLLFNDLKASSYESMIRSAILDKSNALNGAHSRLLAGKIRR